MRLCLALGLSLIALPAFSSPADDSRSLYLATGEAAGLYLELLDRAAEEPAAVAIAMRDEVSKPVLDENTAWLASIGGDGEYARYLPCSEAAFTIGQMAVDTARWLEGEADRPETGDDVAYFRNQFTLCEQALDLPVTFSEAAVR